MGSVPWFAWYLAFHSCFKMFSYFVFIQQCLNVIMQILLLLISISRSFYISSTCNLFYITIDCSTYSEQCRPSHHHLEWSRLNVRERCDRRCKIMSLRSEWKNAKVWVSLFKLFISLYVLEAAQSAALIQERRERQQRQQLDSVTLEKTKDEVCFFHIYDEQ